MKRLVFLAVAAIVAVAATVVVSRNETAMGFVHQAVFEWLPGLFNVTWQISITVIALLVAVILLWWVIVKLWHWWQSYQTQRQAEAGVVVTYGGTHYLEVALIVFGIFCLWYFLGPRFTGWTMPKFTQVVVVTATPQPTVVPTQTARVIIVTATPPPSTTATPTPADTRTPTATPPNLTVIPVTFTPIVVHVPVFGTALPSPTPTSTATPTPTATATPTPMPSATAQATTTPTSVTPPKVNADVVTATLPPPPTATPKVPVSMLPSGSFKATGGSIAAANPARTQANTVRGTGSFRSPLQGYVVTQRFWALHNGVDLAVPIGTNIYASDTGRVVFSGWDNTGYGNMVLVDHGNGYQTRYGHLSVMLVNNGDTVTKGQLIAKSGSTGHSSGPHLHFEVLKNGSAIDPFLFIN